MKTRQPRFALTSTATARRFTPARSDLLQRKCACGGTPGPTGECETCRQKRLQHKSSVGVERQNAVPPIVDEVLRSPGQPLDRETRAFMEPRFGHDFSQVRVHTDSRAAESARAIAAAAYAVNQDIVFGYGRYHPATGEGKLLLAHELTHVVQQRGGGNWAQRQVEGLPTSSAVATPPATSSATQRLLAIIADIEKVKAKATQTPGEKGAKGGASAEHTKELTDFTARLRTVANGSDEQLKLSVLAGFSSEGIQRVEAQADVNAEVRERRSEGIATKSLMVSHPRDAAEIEADRVAQAVAQGSKGTVSQTTSEGMVSRNGGTLVAAGAWILATEAEASPATSWNPPGWVVIGVGVVVAAALIGAGVYMASNVADSGIMDEVYGLIEAAKAAGRALTICEALAQLMAAAKRAGDSARVNKIKATEKAKGCRHSSYS
jgi:Domain of unknown function (DUF4157)/Bacterial toxin 34